MSERAFDLTAFLPYRLAVLSERISRRLAVEYERLHGLSVAEWRVLVHLLRCNEVSVREICNCVNLDKPRVSRAVTRLEELEFVKKIQDPADARLVSITLTKKGRDALGQILPKANTFETQLLERLSPQEYGSFCTIMEKLHSVLDEDPEAKPRSSADVKRVND